jgi:hypothetical protein
MITTLGERRADTGSSTGRLMIAVLGGLAEVSSAILSARAPPKAEAGPKNAANTWADRRD